MLARGDFHAGILAVTDHYRDNERRASWLAPFKVGVAYDMYTQAATVSEGIDFLVCGRTRVDNRGKLAQGTTIENVDIYNLGVTNSSNDDRFNSKGGGAVLHYRDGTGWHPLYNDVWLLGGIHGRKQFHLASPRHKDLLLYPNGDLSVFAKEVITLRTFKYVLIKMGAMRSGSDLGEIARPPSTVRPSSGDLRTLISAVKRYEASPALVMRDIVDVGAVMRTPSQKEVGRWDATANRGPHRF